MKAYLLKPLDGHPEGSIRDFDQADFETLVALEAVRPASESDELRQDGPTIAEFVSAGYKAANYPPHGYASRSSDDEIAAAVAQDAASQSKAAPAVINKMAPPVANKMQPTPKNKTEAPSTIADDTHAVAESALDIKV